MLPGNIEPKHGVAAPRLARVNRTVVQAHQWKRVVPIGLDGRVDTMSVGLVVARGI